MYFFTIFKMSQLLSHTRSSSPDSDIDQTLTGDDRLHGAPDQSAAFNCCNHCGLIISYPTDKIPLFLHIPVHPKICNSSNETTLLIYFAYDQNF